MSGLWCILKFTNFNNWTIERNKTFSQNCRIGSLHLRITNSKKVFCSKRVPKIDCFYLCFVKRETIWRKLRDSVLYGIYGNEYKHCWGIQWKWAVVCDRIWLKWRTSLVMDSMEINTYLVEGKYDIATYQLFQPFFYFKV